MCILFLELDMPHVEYISHYLQKMDDLHTEEMTVKSNNAADNSGETLKHDMTN